MNQFVNVFYSFLVIIVIFFQILQIIGIYDKKVYQFQNAEIFAQTRQFVYQNRGNFFVKIFLYSLLAYRVLGVMGQTQS